MLKSTTGATHHRQRHRHLHPERQGREHRHDRARPSRSTTARWWWSEGGDDVPGFLLHVGATVMCAHGGQAQPTAPNPRVLVSGTADHHDAGALRGGRLCRSRQRRAVTVRDRDWMTAATRVTSNGQPLLLLDSQAICAPNGTPLVIATTQTTGDRRYEHRLSVSFRQPAADGRHRRTTITCAT